MVDDNNGSCAYGSGQGRKYIRAGDVLKSRLTLTKEDSLALDALVSSVCDCGLKLSFNPEETNPKGSLV